MTQSFGDEPQDRSGEDADDAVDRPSTGHARIDDALSRLDGLGDLEITRHPDEFDAIHLVLRESLADAGRDGDAPDAR